MRALLCLALLGAGCPTKKDSRYCNTNADCSDPFTECDPVKHECELPGGGGDGGGGMPLDMSVVACSNSSTCPASSPVCSGGVCGSCNGDSSTCVSFHSATPVCGASGACVECTSNTDCTPKAATPFCGPAQTCVECLKSSDCTPHVCGGDNACRACQANAECPSGVCGTDGNCVDPSMIALVDNGGMTIANCNTARAIKNGQTPATAYCDIGDAGFKPYVLVTGHGSSFPYTAFQAGSETLVGPGYKAATPAVITLNGGTTQTAGVWAATTGAARVDLTVDGFEVTTGSKFGISCSAGITTPHSTLTIRNSYVHDNSNDSVSTSNCDLTITDSHISTGGTHDIIDSSGTIVDITLLRDLIDSSYADGMNLYGNVTMDRCIVANNSLGNGLQLNGGAPNPTFKITNSIFYLNSKGLELNITSTAPNGIFQFNTVVRNDTGIACYGPNTIQDSIVWGNMDVNPDGGFNEAQSGCIVRGVATDNGPPPAFVDNTSPATYDFRLAVDTPAHIAANQACCIDKASGPADGGTALSNHDIDGTKRPKGAGYDVGAHEAM